jgi:hypothetical protein
MQEPTGPVWYQEEQARKAKELERMTQEKNDLIDPQDDIDLEERRKKKKPRERTWKKILRIKMRCMILTLRR